MREMKCPVCAAEVPRALLRSKVFPCPNCKVALRGKDFNPLLAIPVMACGYSLAFVLAERTGLKGWGLGLATIFLGSAACFLIAVVAILFPAWVIGLPLPLEMAIDPGPTLDDGRILGIESPPTRPRGPE